MTRTWWENEEILTQFRQWLTETDQEIDDLDDTAWPESASAKRPDDAPEPLEQIGLLSVVEALTAMRQELKLQTKSSRGLEEAVQTARAGLEAAIRQFQSVQAREAESAQRAALPLVEALAGLDESLLRGAKAFEATRRHMVEAGPRRLRDLLAERFNRLPRWRRWLAGACLAQAQDECAATMARVNDEEFARLAEGYKLIQDRVEKELHRHGLRRIETVGRRFDPACMSVVELADPGEGPPETVVEQLRPGYTWGERVIRFAEVRAVASAPGPPAREPGEAASAGGESIETVE